MKTRELLHPLSAVRAFEAVARLRSVSAAAQDLGVTQPAISQQVKKLERHLRVKLVERVSNTIRLSPEGEKLAISFHTAFGILREGMEEAMAQGQVTLAVLGGFAQRWLIPRLADLQEKHPDIDLRLITRSRIDELDRGGVDLVIRSGRKEDVTSDAVFLMRDEARIVMSPDLMARKPILKAADLEEHFLIRVENSPRDKDWPRWLDESCESGFKARGWLSFANSSHALEAAMAGVGVAIGHWPMVMDAMLSGRLISPLGEVIDEDIGNYIVLPLGRTDSLQVEQLKEWLIEQAKVDFCE